jgi:hypothetical protein
MRRRPAIPSFLIAALAAAPLATAGCASSGSSRYLAPEADLGAIRTVAVLPFETLTGERADADKVQRVFVGELLATGAVEVVEPGRVAQLLGREGVTAPGALAPADLTRLGQALEADGLFLGTVVDFAEQSTGTVRSPEVTIELRLVETASGRTAWQTTAGRSGPNARARLFGFGGDSLTEAARRLVREQLEALVR